MFRQIKHDEELKTGMLTVEHDYSSAFLDKRRQEYLNKQQVPQSGGQRKTVFVPNPKWERCYGGR